MTVLTTTAVRKVEHAIRSGEAVIAHYTEGGQVADQEALSDVLTDLRHWALRYDVNFDRALESSARHCDGELYDATVDKRGVPAQRSDQTT